MSRGSRRSPSRRRYFSICTLPGRPTTIFRGPTGRSSISCWSRRKVLARAEKGRSGVVLTEHLGTEDVDFGVLGLPGIGRQPGLDAGLLQKGGTVPAVFGRHLREQYATVVAFLDVDAVP